MLIHFKHICVFTKEERFFPRPSISCSPGKSILCGLPQPPITPFLSLGD